MTKTPLLVVFFGLACAGCATTPDQTAEPREQRVYRTGSNLPVRDGTVSPDTKTLDGAWLEQQLPPGRNPHPQ